ncbi:MAG: hypothetical protein WCM93_01810 [Bacteroidota bacterium]
MVKRFLIFILILSLASCSLFSQETQKPATIEKPQLSLSGYVKADAIFDSRQIVEAREGFLLLYPKNHQYDKFGNDLNENGSFNQYAMTARLTLKATGPDILGAKAFALIESDFTGASNSENNSLRLRHAYFKLTWPSVSLLAGQYWHPLDIPEMLPSVLSLNTGTPFRSFSRQPQARVDAKLWKLNFVLAATSQRDYINTGPSGQSYNYLRNSIIPNLFAQVNYSDDILFAGFGIDYKRLTPRLVTDSLVKANEHLECFSGIVFFKAKLKLITFKAQASIGQALNDHLMLGGYGVTGIDTLTDRRTYKPLNYFSGWIGANTNGPRLQFALFAGYSKGFGSKAQMISSNLVYARDPDIEYTYRISPMVTYIAGKFSIISEVEITTAAYGKPDGKYRVKDSSEVGNLRATVAGVYNF